MALRISSAKPPSLSTSSALLRNRVTLPRCSSGMSSRRILSSFLENHARQANPRPWRVWGYHIRAFLLSSSLTSPSGTGALSDFVSPSTRGINDSIVLRHAIVCWDNRERHMWGGVRYKSYIAMIQDGGETSHDGLEWGKGVCRFLDQVDG